MPDVGSALMPVTLEAAGDTHIGGRTHNEDSILLRPDLNLYLVADGAGGQNAGNVASSLAVTSIAHFFERTKTTACKLPDRDSLGLRTAARRLSAAIQGANREILDISKTSDRHRGMGTTIVALLCDETMGMADIAYVGDSRCYRLRGGRMEQLTYDHSLMNDVLELRPNIADERVKKLPRNVITRALGMMDNLRVSVRSHEIMPGDRYLLCSDGVSDMLSRAQIANTLAADVACDERVRVLIKLALKAGANDNVAALVIDCTAGDADALAATRPARTRRSGTQSPANESAEPEILLYDEQAGRRDSTPLVHVVPAESRSAAFVEAMQGVMTPAGGEPELDDDDGDDGDDGRVVIAPPPPDSEPAIESDSDPDLDDDGPEGSGDRAGRYAIIDEGPAGGRQQRSPSKPAAARLKRTSPGLGGRGALPGARKKPKASSAPPKASSKPPRRRSISVPRLHKPDVDDGEPSHGRTGDTAAPPSPLQAQIDAGRRRMKATPPETPESRDSQPAPVEAKNAKVGRSTIHGTPPPPGSKPPAAVAPVPPAREPFDTSEFLGELSRPCHACQSIISVRATHCMYCGAETGFVLRDGEATSFVVEEKPKK